MIGIKFVLLQAVLLIMIMEQNTYLRVHIKHSKPVEINEFTTSLNSISNLFSSYVQKHGEIEEQTKAKLYVEKIQEGSIIVCLTELVTSTLLPFAENVNIIVEFATFIKDVYNYFINGSGEKPELTLSECNDFNNMLSLVAGDNKGEMAIGAVIRGDNNNVLVGCTFNYIDSNAGQNQLKLEAERLRAVAPLSEKYSRQLMTIYQLRSDMDSNVGNKAIIESLSHKKVSVVFETDKLKEDILNSESNPVKKAFLVDVEVQTVNNRIAAYKVLALHDVIDIE